MPSTSPDTWAELTGPYWLIGAGVDDATLLVDSRQLPATGFRPRQETPRGLTEVDLRARAGSRDAERYRFAKFAFVVETSVACDVERVAKVDHRSVEYLAGVAEGHAEGFEGAKNGGSVPASPSGNGTPSGPSRPRMAPQPTATRANAIAAAASLKCRRSIFTTIRDVRRRPKSPIRRVLGRREEGSSASLREVLSVL